MNERERAMKLVAERLFQALDELVAEWNFEGRNDYTPETFGIILARDALAMAKDGGLA
jgi:hypothetical protein